MKKIITLFVVLIVALSSVLPVYAADGKVTYSGNAGNFVFEPGSDHSLTDLFPNFKDVMPGDTLTQQITVKNNADNKVKVKIYIRSLGAHEDSVDFLSKLGLKVAKSEENKMAYMFDAKANETAQLTDWVCLGTLYSGGEVNLDVTLTVPVELDNEFQNDVGYLDWEFMIEEFPIEEGDPKPPQTGDNSHMGLWFALMIGSLTMLIILLFWRKKDKENEENAVQR
ncbi:MAG: LPXTG cell wall anchor domain-containing protein [Clostridia bacterium]|nr:LPXTG cell wall anchor domain-containing protein [Clostridia bacterium]